MKIKFFSFVIICIIHVLRCFNATAQTQQLIDMAYVTGSYPFATGDLNNDGLNDIIKWSSDHFSWFEQLPDADGQFMPHSLIDTTDFATSQLECVDLNGDGRQDLIGSATDLIKVAINEDSDSLQFSIHTLYSYTPVLGYHNELKFQTGDIDKDGDIDILLLIIRSAENELGWYENTGGDPESFLYHLISFTIFKPDDILASDFDNDSDLDFIAAEHDYFINVLIILKMTVMEILINQQYLQMWAFMI